MVRQLLNWYSGGSTTIGKYCIIGGGCVINGHIEIVDGVTITGMGMVMRSITEKGMYSSGIPLQPNKDWRKTAARVHRIDEMNKRLKTVEKTYRERARNHNSSISNKRLAYSESFSFIIPSN